MLGAAACAISLLEMKTLILASSLCIFLHVSLRAERAASNQPRVPPVTIERAIKLVYACQKKEPNAKPIFIDEVIFVREAKKTYWKVGVRTTEHETGHLFYAVSSDGKVTSHSVVKDG